jgi:hypothetical protein
MAATEYSEPIIKPSPILQGITYIEWTLACCKEELFQNLVNYKILEDRYWGKVPIYPYRQRAEQIIYKIPVYDPRPVFIISESTLTQPVKSHLEVFNGDVSDNVELRELLNETVLNAVGRIFENINARYYQASVRKYLVVEFVN